MKRGFLILMVSLLTTAAMAQVNKVPADTRLYLQTLENGNKQVRARSGEGADDGTPMRIYTTDGRLVASTTLTGGCVSLPAASPAGVYAVQVGTLGSTLIRK